MDGGWRKATSKSMLIPSGNSALMHGKSSAPAGIRCCSVERLWSLYWEIVPFCGSLWWLEFTSAGEREQEVRAMAKKIQQKQEKQQ
eukprot:COSAG02_NODE_3271_length_7032_cov_60.609028_6_plen_86_part_00